MFNEVMVSGSQRLGGLDLVGSDLMSISYLKLLRCPHVPEKL